MKKMMIYTKNLKEFLFPSKILYYVKTFKNTSLFDLKYLILSKTIQLCTCIEEKNKRRIQSRLFKKKKSVGFKNSK
jgi:hypothetical protein